MVNRVLIRIKVVQLLYSYLLSQREFKIETPAESPSRDKKYGYELYIDILMLMLELSGIDTADGRRESPLRGIAPNRHIDHNALAKSLASMPELRSIMLKGKSDLTAFYAVARSIYEEIPTLPAYKSYIRIKKPDLRDDITLWLSIVENLMVKNPQFMAACRENPEFTLAGFTRATNDVRHTLSDYGDNRSLLTQARNSLDHSLDKAYELYLSLLSLPVSITRAQERRIDEARHKNLPTDEDLNPNLRFVENKLVKALEANEEIAKFMDDGKTAWDADDLLTASLLDAIAQSEIYIKYMSAPEEPGFEQDTELWRDLMRTIILPGDSLAESLESKSVYWNDDLHIIGTFVVKTLRRYATSKNEGTDVAPLPQFKDEEDSKFGPELFLSAVRHAGEYKELIDKFVNSSRWDADRLAFMDIVIMTVAITELLDYPAIPIPVTLNEYIEIANAYSTPRSGSFINGILYSVINHLKQEGKLLKN